MKNKTWVGMTYLLLAMGLAVAGCGGDGPIPDPPPAILTAPSAVGRPVSSELVHGSVFDTALRPLAGATVEVLDGPQAHTSKTTDALGQFSLSGTFDNATRFQARAEGYIPAIAAVHPTSTSRQMVFYLVLTAPSVNMSGDYTLTITAGQTCANLPDDARVRSYSASVTPHPSSPATYFEVRLSGAPFLEAFSREERAVIAVAGAEVALWFGAEGQPALVEQLSPTSYLAFGGTASATVAAPDSSIATRFDGFIDYCVMPSADELPIAGHSYTCVPAKALTHARCEASAHRLTLSRR